MEEKSSSLLDYLNGVLECEKTIFECTTAGKLLSTRSSELCLPMGIKKAGTATAGLLDVGDLGALIFISVFEAEQQAYDLADLFIDMGVIPARFRMDGVHIAMAAVNELDCIISLSFIISTSRRPRQRQKLSIA